MPSGSPTRQAAAIEPKASHRCWRASLPEAVGAVGVFLEQGEIVPGPGEQQKRDGARRHRNGREPRPGPEAQAGERIGGEQREGESEEPEAEAGRDARKGVAGRRDEAGGPSDGRKDRDEAEDGGREARQRVAHQRRDRARRRCRRR